MPVRQISYFYTNGVLLQFFIHSYQSTPQKTPGTVDTLKVFRIPGKDILPVPEWGLRDPERS